jgi:beta-galactosidase
VKHGVNEQGKTIRYIFNYAAKPVTVNYSFGEGRELLQGEAINKNKVLQLEPWGFKIIEEK